MNNMAQTDLVGQENIAYGYEELETSELPAGRGSMPGKPLQKIDKDVLVSGRGCVP